MSGKVKNSFVLDSSLGKLAKWLRILGFDAIYIPGIPEKSFMASVSKGRILLTRARSIQKKYSGSNLLFIRYNDPWDQIKQVISELNLSFLDIHPFSRCIRCNGALQEVAKKNIRGFVPDYVYETQNKFSQCKVCQRIYWPGTHLERSIKVIHGLFPHPGDRHLSPH